jgi:N-acetyl-alpha-D-muramate 1-phosphate uridylyltransferase
MSKNILNISYLKMNLGIIMIKQVFILAAGRGSRMMPLTKNIPKPLIEVNGVSMLDRILAKVNHLNNIENIVVNGFYLADKLESHIYNLKNHKIRFVKENEQLETGGGLVNALPFFDKNEPILIINGDIVWDNDDLLENFINVFEEGSADILLGVKKKESFLGYNGDGDFDIINNSVIRNKSGAYVYTGIQILHPKILELIELPVIPFSLSHFFNNSGKIKLDAIELRGNMFHIGDPESLQKYNDVI